MKKIERDPRNDADVRLLLQVFSDLAPDGRRILHTQIEGVLKVPRLSSRYRTVVNRWRKIVLAERCMYLDGMTAEGKGFVVLTPDEMVRFGNRKVRSAGREFKKAITVMALPDDAVLSEDMRRYRGLLLMAAEKIYQQHKTELREVSKALAPIKQLPRASGG